LARLMVNPCSSTTGNRAEAEDERVRREIEQAVDRVNQNFAPIEQIKRFVLLDRDLSEPAGELTPTANVKRQAVYDKHRHRLDALYAMS
jgi:long-chain acyl-CoA synthetase